MLWGIDLGGTKIEGVVLESKSHMEPLCRLRVETHADRGYEHVLTQIETLVEMMKKQVSAIPEAIGFSTPGVLDPKTLTMKNCNSQCLNGQPLQRDLEKRLNIRARLSNDANCFALSETLFGAARGSDCAFGVILGTGVGGGVVVRGQVLDGCQGIGGEWGHNILADDGPQCYCGKRGCVEMFISGPALEQYYFEQSGVRLRLREVAERARAGQDKAAEATLKRLIQYFGRAITVVINIIDPDIVVLGGGVSNIDELYLHAKAEVQKYIFNNRVETKIVKHQLGDSAGVFGAALLVS